MKKSFMVLCTILFLGISPNKANAGFYTSGYFEPVMGATLGAAAGYLSSKDNQAMNAAIYGAGGLLLGYALNSYYRSKVDAVYENEIYVRKTIIKEKQVARANKANLGLTDQYYSIEATQVEEGQTLSDGSIQSDTIRVMLKAP